MFDMNLLIKLYKTDVNKGREMLYENIGILAPNVNNLIRDDVLSESFIIADECIRKSLDKYSSKQIYSYIKKTLGFAGFIKKNFYDEIHGAYVIGDDSYLVDETDKIDYEAFNYIMSFILLFPEIEKRVIILKMDGYNISKIAKIIGKSRKQTYLIYERIKKRFKRYFKLLYDTDENCS